MKIELNINILSILLKIGSSIAQTCSVKEVFLEVLKNSQETPMSESFFK